MTFVCPECGGSGEIVVAPLGINPFSGVPVPDPQLEDIIPCPRCAGPRTRAPRTGRSIEQVIRSIEDATPGEDRRAS